VLREIMPTVGGHSPLGNDADALSCQMASIQSGGYNVGSG